MAAESMYQYNMKHKKRGVALIINNKNFDNLGTRLGTEVDEREITKKLKALDFDVRPFNDLKSRKMKSILDEVSREDHSENDCFACVILSHGEKDSVLGTDESVEISDLLEPFKGHRCETLAGKPKLFFIQACRGTELDEGTALGVKSDGDDDDEPVSQRIPTEADFLVAYSSVSGFYSFRNLEKGSWFIQALCAALEEFGTTLDLMTLMTRVNHKVAYEFKSESKSRPQFHDKKQIPCITSMLTKDVIFHPKGA